MAHRNVAEAINGAMEVKNMIRGNELAVDLKAGLVRPRIPRLCEENRDK